MARAARSLHRGRCPGPPRGAEAPVGAPSSEGFPTGGAGAPPLLAIEIAGRDDTEASLREKAAWYLAHGVGTVWLILPESREVIVIRGDAETRHRKGERLAQSPELPGLEPDVDAFFRQLAGES